MSGAMDDLTPSQGAYFERLRTQTVCHEGRATVISYNPRSGEVETRRATRLWFYAGLDQNDHRTVDLTADVPWPYGKPQRINFGGRLPQWLAAVAGDVPPGFPAEPTAFSDWFDDWLARTRPKVICDLRRGAEAAGYIDGLRWAARARA